MKKMKKNIAVAMSCVMISQSMIYAQAEPDVSGQSTIMEATGTDAVQNFMAESAKTSTGYVYQVNSDKTITITGYEGTNTNLTIPSTIDGKKVTTIAEKAFYENKKLQKVVISEGITTVKGAAFYGCKKLSEVSLPSTITSLDGYYGGIGIFENCELLQTVTIKQGSKAVSMGSYMFKNCKSLQSITIPKNYVKIGNECFAYCGNLTGFTWNGDASKELNIDSDAFYECKSLKAANIPEGVVGIGNGAFYNCAALTSVSIPSTMEKIGTTYGAGVFVNCNSLKTVTIKSGQQSAYIGVSTFRNCQSLQSISIPGNYEKINDRAFEKCISLKTLEYKSSGRNYSNQTIGSYAFASCTNLMTVTLSKTVGSIGSSAFENDTALKSITIPEGTSAIGSGAFSGCTALESVSLPSTMETLGSSAFYNCSSLKNISWTAGSILATIGLNCFSSCTSLVSLTIPGNCDIINSDAFAYCTALQSVTWLKGTHGSQSQSLSGSVFYGCKNLKKVCLMSTVGSIGSNVFYQCDNVTIYGQKGSYAETYAKQNDIPFQVYTGQALKITGKSSTSSISVGGKITLTGTATGGNGSYTYSYLVHNKDTNQWSRLTSSFTSSNTYTWTAGSAGNREFFIEVKDASGKTVRSSAINVSVANTLKITGKSNTSTVNVGGKVTLTGTASGGRGGYTYSYLVHNKDTDKWSRLTSSFTSSNTYTWTAGSAGNREFFIEVKDSTGKVVRGSAINVSVTNTKPLAITAKSSASTVVKGGKITITGTASGGKGGYTYSYLIHNKDTNEWSRLTSSFTGSNTYSWTAGSTGNREFFVEVKDSTGKVVRSSAVNVKVQNASSNLNVTIGSSAVQASVNSTITLFANASGGKGGYTYSYLVHNKDTDEWHRFNKNFTTNNIYNWKATSKGNRDFFVEVKDSTGKVVRSKAMNIVIR